MVGVRGCDALIMFLPTIEVFICFIGQCLYTVNTQFTIRFSCWKQRAGSKFGQVSGIGISSA